MTTPPASLLVSGRPAPAPTAAEFGIQSSVPTVPRSSGPLPAAAVEVWITLCVGDASGEDGALNAEVRTHPVVRVLRRIPRLTELPGRVIDDAGERDAWYGNDAPELIDNRLTFEAWAGERIAVRWDAMQP